MECSVCITKCNKSNRKEIICNYCEYTACRECYQTYITSQSQDAQCMNCKKIFTNDFITNNFTAVFINTTLKSHREVVLFDREKSLLPSTQPYVLVEKEKSKLRILVNDLEVEKRNILKKLHENGVAIRDVLDQINGMTVNNLPTSSTEERRKFIRKCPVGDCRGFLSSQWKCGVCDVKVCNKCNEERRDENHECNPENVASMELLNKDTKPCPQCGVMIHRISGCPQMFCVDCHTPWDWNTGRVITGVIHNPHYYDFMRRGGNLNREHGDIPCGGLPDLRTLNRKLYLIKEPMRDHLYRNHNVVTHLLHHEIRNVIPQQNEETNRSLRVKYLMNEISEEQFKTTLQMNEKKISKQREFHNLFQMYIDVCSDIFRQMMSMDAEKILEQYTILVNLKSYFNDQSKKISKHYKCVNPGITDHFQYVGNYDTYIKRQRNAQVVQAEQV